MDTTNIKWDLNTYLNYLSDNVPLDDKILHIPKWTWIETNFQYTRWESSIEWLLTIPWILQIVKWDKVNGEYFPRTHIKGVLLIYLARYLENIVEFIPENVGKEQNTEDIINQLLKGDLPTTETIQNLKILDFQMI